MAGGRDKVTQSRLTQAGRKFMSAMDKLGRNKTYVKAGVIAADFDDTKDGSDDGKTTIGKIAVAMEFGTRTIPARSFIGFAANRLQKVWLKQADKIRKKVVKGRLSPRQGLNLMGQVMQRGIVARITTIRRPPLALSTQEAKNSTKPLIDTNQLRSTIAYEVHSR